MKTLKYISLAIYLAALLTSCINEEYIPTQEAMLQVTLTRSSNTSLMQGDKIQDIMLWAFDVNNGYQLVGWREYTPTTATYSSISIHLPVKMCGSNGGLYRVVAVVNKTLFTDAQGEQIALSSSTTHDQLISGRFVSQAVMESNINDDTTTATPEAMPVTHWCDVAVTPGNLHSTNNCVPAALKVFRTVAKTKFSIARASDFNLEIQSLKLISRAIPTEGMILSKALAGDLESEAASTSWFGTNKPATKSEATSIDLISAPVTVSAAANTQQLLGSRFIYENSESCSYAQDGLGVPSGNGYYYEISYSVDGGTPITRYVGINQAVVRNHNYHVQAKVQANGQIQLSYIVAEWDEVEWNIDFANPVHSELMTAPSSSAAAPTITPTLYYDNANPEAGAFVGYFKMDSPIGITWKPTLSNASADDYQIKVYSNLDSSGNVMAEGYTREVTDAEITAMADTWYKIVVIAKGDNEGQYPKLGITHRPEWNPEANPLLIINKGSQHNGLYYPFGDWDTTTKDNHPDMFWITIKQVAHP